MKVIVYSKINNDKILNLLMKYDVSVYKASNDPCGDFIMIMRECNDDLLLIEDSS